MRQKPEQRSLDLAMQRVPTKVLVVLHQLETITMLLLVPFHGVAGNPDNTGSTRLSTL
jgi:hypothetical protein